MCYFLYIDRYYLNNEDVNINYIFFKNLIDIIDVIYYFVEMNFVIKMFIKHCDISFFKVRIS